MVDLFTCIISTIINKDGKVMIKWDGIHWNIYEILPYQRNFNFINGERSIGKTYSGLGYFINYCLKNKLEFIYMVRTIKEKDDGVLNEATLKVLQNEFPNLKTKCTNDVLYYEDENEVNVPLIQCLSISDYARIKKRSFPNVKFIVMDEYMIESDSTAKYIKGFKEPDLFLSIYHTVDREEDRVICFFFGNNTTFFNPYHIHPAFNIQPTKQGEIWTSKYVLFQWAVASEELKKLKAKNSFLQMIDNTEYGKYAKDGEYMESGIEFVEKLKGKAIYRFTITYKGETYSVRTDNPVTLIYIGDKVEEECKIHYALTNKDHQDNRILATSKQFTHLKWLAQNYKMGLVRFESSEIKVKFEEAIYKLL